MGKQFNFKIESILPYSALCKAHGIVDFLTLCNRLKNLPYGRTKNKNDFSSILTEHKGTCSTKHAFIKQVAIENNCVDLQLFIGIYKMNEDNTRGVGRVLANTCLEYIPEAHTYLKINGKIIDLTRATNSVESFQNTLLTETKILPTAIVDFKTNYHQNYLKQWLIKQNIKYKFDALWRIRELCIRALSA